MALLKGTSLGPYEIVDEIGAGGMGEVYKAADRRLNRTVAVKVLPARFSDDPEMKQRFDREAKTVAALNHPHICTLHDIGHAEIETEDARQRVDYLVMEYLEGTSLAERLGNGPLPFAEAMKVAIQIADALEKAHARGVTHRDLKPGNIMLTPGGAKLLDFGLAKLRQAPQAGEDTSVSGAGPNTTVPGTIMGTMQYMAPEQLEGKEADTRTDIFAFGAVLYEMITGRKAFEGKSQPHLIAAIVSTQPEPVSTLEPAVPRVLDFLVESCLEKDPERRLQTATDLVWELRWIAEGGAHAAPISFQRRRLAKAAPFALGGVALLVAALLTALALAPRGADAGGVTRFLIDVPDMPVAEAVSVSPDGRTVAYSAREGGSTAVFVRPMLVDAPQKLEGTDGAERLFWSPDSRWIAFFAGGRLRRVEATGGPPQNIAETDDLLGGTWNANGEILFATSGGLQRVVVPGGEPSPVAVSVEEGPPREPYFLPDGRRFLFLAGESIYAGSLDSPEATPLITAESNPVYAEPGYLLYHRAGTLYAQPFDAGGLTVEGEAIRLADGLPTGANGAAAFAVSHTGVLLYRNDPVRIPDRVGGVADGTNIGAEPPLMWLDRQGRAETASAPARWIGVDLSPDGEAAAVHRHDPDGGDIWTFDVGEPTPTRFTFDASQENSTPLWSPDGTQIAFASRRNGRWGLYVKPADRTRDETLVVETEGPAAPMSWTPDGGTLVYSVNAPQSSGDIWKVAAGSAGAREPEAVSVLQTRADERNPQVSPDGRWLAYSSNFTGRSEVYIRPFPEGPGETQVSVNGGVFPRWRSDGRELYFMNLVSYGGMMASAITVDGSSIRREVPRRLVQTHFVNLPHAGVQHHAYAVSADGGRFLLPQFDTPLGAFGGGTPLVGALVPRIAADRASTGASSTSSGPITVVLDWTAAVGQ